MKTLIINGSPHKNGHTTVLVCEFEKVLQTETEIVRPFEHFDNIVSCKNCTGQKACKHTGECFIKDKMNLVYADDYDNVVVASPIYMSGLPGPMINVWSRLQIYYNLELLGRKRSLINKHGGLILTGGGYGTCNRAISQGKRLLQELNATINPEDMIFSLNTDETPARQDEEAIDSIKKLALRFRQYDKK